MCVVEKVPVLFAYRGLDDYVASASDTGGAFAVAFREAPEEERERMKQEIADAFAPFSVDGGYELPGVALVAVAR